MHWLGKQRICLLAKKAFILFYFIYITGVKQQWSVSYGKIVGLFLTELLFQNVK